jgi:hypothetical protein
MKDICKKCEDWLFGGPGLWWAFVALCLWNIFHEPNEDVAGWKLMTLMFFSLCKAMMKHTVWSSEHAALQADLTIARDALKAALAQAEASRSAAVESGQEAFNYMTESWKWARRWEEKDLECEELKYQQFLLLKKPDEPR